MKDNLKNHSKWILSCPFFPSLSNKYNLRHSLARMLYVPCVCSREPQAGLQNISADGWFLTSIILAPLFVLCSPLKMWFLLEADALVHMVPLRINP